MGSFIYSYPTRVYFGNGAAKKAFDLELNKFGKKVMLAYGGGSVIDCCKVISAQSQSQEDIWTMEYEKGIYPQSGIPIGAVVTVSGTGAEMNEEQFENSMSFVRENAKNADVHEGLFIRAADTDGIVEFLKENGFVD